LLEFFPVAGPRLRPQPAAPSHPPATACFVEAASWLSGRPPTPPTVECLTSVRMSWVMDWFGSVVTAVGSRVGISQMHHQREQVEEMEEEERPFPPTTPSLSSSGGERGCAAGGGALLKASRARSKGAAGDTGGAEASLSCIPHPADKAGARRVEGPPPRKKSRTDHSSGMALAVAPDLQTVRTSSAVVSLVADIVSATEPTAAATAAATTTAAAAAAPPSHGTASPHTTLSLETAASQKPSTPQMNEMIREQFAEYDLDGDGRISVGELRKALRRLGVGRDLSDVEIGAILRQSDRDGDGYVSFDEFTPSPTPRALPPLAPRGAARRVVDVSVLPDGWQHMASLSQRRKALLRGSGGRGGSTAYLTRLKNALLYELSRSLEPPPPANPHVGTGNKVRQKQDTVSRATIAWIDDEVLRLLGEERQCLAALGQCMPDQAHRQPVWDDGEPGLLNLRLRRFSGKLYVGDDGAFSNHGRLRNPSRIRFADLTASIAARSSAFSPDHIHQGCLGNCYFCAALSLLAKIGRSSLHSCVRELADNGDCSVAGGERRFEVRFKRTKETRAGVSSREYSVVVDDWFWVSRASGPICPCGGTHNVENTPVYLKTTDRTAEGEIWPMVLEKAFALFLARLNAEEGRELQPSYELLEPGRNGLGAATAGVVFSAVTGHPFQLVGGVQKRGLTAETVEELWRAVQNGLSATVGTPHLTEVQQKQLMVYSDHEYAIVRCEIYLGEP
jgi:hypothetical protein